MCSMCKDVQYVQRCAVPIRYIISTSEDVHYKQVNHQVLAQEGTNQKYFPMNESLLLITYQVKMASSLWQVAKIHQLWNTIVNF